MKQYVKYIIILLLGLLLHESSENSINRHRLSFETADTECCFLTQAPNDAQQAIHDFYRHLHQLSLCMDYPDPTGVPEIKCMLLWVKYLLAEGGTDSPEWHTSYPPHRVYDHPQDYYIFTLRKIVI